MEHSVADQTRNEVFVPSQEKNSASPVDAAEDMVGSSSSVAASQTAPNGGGESQNAIGTLRLRSLLAESERRAEAARKEADTLREANLRLVATNDRKSRTLDTLRRQYDELQKRVDEERERAQVAVGETTRLRVEVVDCERELETRIRSCEEAQQRLSTERKRAAALESVVMGLRRRVALAEEKAVDSKQLEEAVSARDEADSRFIEARADAERWRARCAAADVIKNRAAESERRELALREKVIALRKEVEGKESLVRQGLAERRRLKEMLARRERAIEEQEVKITALRRQSKKPRTSRVDEPREVAAQLERPFPKNDDLESTRTPSVAEDLTEDLGAKRGEQWEADAELESVALSGKNFSEDDGSDVAVRVLEASPLLREMEEAHAQLQAAVFDNNEEEHPALPSKNLDDRVRILEQSFKEIYRKSGATGS